VLVAVALLAAAATSGCSGSGRPVVVSREALGTVVTVTLHGQDESALRAAAESAFAEMAVVEAQLDPYDATSTIAVFNEAPYDEHVLPAAAVAILDRVEALGVSRQFSPTLLGVTDLYDFGGAPSVPATDQLRLAVAQAQGFARRGDSARFEQVVSTAPPSATATPSAATTASMPPSARPRPGLDFGGAAKGLAIDRAMRRLTRVPEVTGAMITAGSSTSVWGRKRDDEPWRVGIEDPREPGTVVAVVGSHAPTVLNISTSGDYQQYFERDGIRYHHILDPATGRPARGLRSLTVYGAISGTDADILSTALFVAGPTAAKDWARRHGVGLYAIDALGRVITVSAPRAAGVSFERLASPTRR